MDKKNALIIILGLVSVPVVYFLLQWLIVDVQIDPQWLSLVIVYLVLVVPQYRALQQLDKINALEEGEDINQVQGNKWNLIPFVNDWILTSYYNDGSVFKVIVSWTLKLSSIVLIVSTLYNNFLVVFIDLGATGALISIYAMLISLFLWFVSKAVIVCHFIYSLLGPLWAILGLFYPFGFMAITSGTNFYLYSSEQQRTSNVLGVDYDED